VAPGVLRLVDADAARFPKGDGFSQRWILTLGTLTSGCDVQGSPGAGAARVQRMAW
jgi:hypothetical protein